MIWSEPARRFFDAHAIAGHIAAAAQVREHDGALLLPYTPREGSAFVRIRPLPSGHAIQPKGVPLTLWWPLGAPKSAKLVLVCEGESDALAALSARFSSNGDGRAREGLRAANFVAAIPGTGYPVDRLVDELVAAGTREAYLAFDADESGHGYAAEAAKALRAVGIEPLRVPLPEGRDLSECLADADDRAAWLAETLLTAEALAEEVAAELAAADTQASVVTPDTDLPAEPGPDEPVVTWASEVEREQVQWLWPGRVPRATLTVIMGTPGKGKSMLTCWLAAEASQRGECALLLSAEDSEAFTVEPRLAAWEARMDQIGFLSMRRSGFLEDLALPDDVDHLRAMALKHEAKLIVIDPLAAHFGAGVDPFRDPSVRRALAPLRRLAEEIGVAIIVVIHLNKSTGTDPIMRAGGSIGQMGAARSALLVADDPDDPEGEDGQDRVVAHVKCNVASKARSLKFRIESIQLDDPERTQTAKIIHVGDSAHSGRDLLAAALNAGADAVAGGSKLQQAKSYLVMRLGDGPREVDALIQGAVMLGISETTLRRAKKELGVRRDRVSLEGESRGEGFWTWRLPDPGERDGVDDDELEDDELEDDE